MCTTCQSSTSRAEIEKNIYLNLYQGTARKTLYPMYLPSACFNLLVSYILILCNIQKSRIKLVKLGKICDGKRKPASLLVHMKMFADQKFHHRIVENQIYLPALCNWNSSANYKMVQIIKVLNIFFFGLFKSSTTKVSPITSR